MRNYNDKVHAITVCTITIAATLFLCYTLLYITEVMKEISTTPPRHYAPESKMDSPLYERVKLCIDMCHYGNYHHHHLKQTHMAKCIP